MADRTGPVMPSRQDRQAARLRGAGTAKIKNVGFRIEGGPPIRTRTPARTPLRTPASTRRPQLEDLPGTSNIRGSSKRTPMPSTASNVKKQPAARGGSGSQKKSNSEQSIDPPSDPIITPALRRRGRPPSKSAQATPVIDPLEATPEADEIPSSSQSPTSPRQVKKRKSLARDTRPTPAKKSRKSPSPTSPPSPSSVSESPSEVSSPESTPPPAPSSAKPKKRRQIAKDADSDIDPGTIEIRVHKLAPHSGGIRHLNEIDGFLQVTTEFLTLTAQRIQRQDATQAKILDAFTEEVTIRLIEMTDAWDNHAVLQAAVRRAQKRKNALRQELLAIRRERGEFQREMEAVRQAHEIGEKEMADIKRQQDFIGDMEDLRARINGGDEPDQIKNGIEAALMELRPLVAGKYGIVERLASFNRFLERFDAAVSNLSG